MRRVTFVVATLLFAAGIAYGQMGAKGAKADLVNAQGEKMGTATLTQAESGVNVALEVSKLSPGLHGLHIHAVGKCDPPDFKTAGSHFNPHGKKHGLKNPEGAHAGDLQNLKVEADGSAKAVVVVTQVTLGEGTNSLFHPEGTAIVIHASPDDEVTDPAGNAGARIACGVITKAE